MHFKLALTVISGLSRDENDSNPDEEIDLFLRELEKKVPQRTLSGVPARGSSMRTSGQGDAAAPRWGFVRLAGNAHASERI